MSTMTPDGRILTITGNPHGFMGRWLFLLSVYIKDNVFRLHCGARGGQESILLNSPIARQSTVREANQGRTRLVSIENEEHGGTTLVWQSDFHEVSTFVHGRDVPLQTLPSMLGSLELRDSRDGMTVLPRLGSGVRVAYELGANSIPDVATVTVKPLEEATEQVPRAGGKAVRGGLLWRDDLYGGGTERRRMLILANSSTATFLMPFDPSDGEFPALIESIEFTLS